MVSSVAGLVSSVVTDNPVHPELLNGDLAAVVKALEWTGHQ
jgi:hypothetical protein